MSAGKYLFTFMTGVAAGVAAAYYTDPKGSEKRLKSLKKDFRKQSDKWEKILTGKLNEYKKTYNDMIDKYSQTGKEMIDKSKDKVSLN
ncbi:MAG: hypothetical protein KI791_21570 [Cyclobacteriaceae bacterium]|nr:hypothetical protein [Cyclobacteriaceae bacterium SS2]